MVFSQREWHSHLSKAKWKNPILEGQKYLGYLESDPNLKYRDVANKFRVSKARVSQMIALVKRLPQEILYYLTSADMSQDLSYFTERKLRPLTLMESDDKKIEKFLQMSKYQINI
jgi:hypothetical protein